MNFYGKIIEGKIVFGNKREIEQYLQENDGKTIFIRIDRMTGVRTETQNNALHLFFELLATELNNAGYTVQKVLQHVVDLNWNKRLVKEVLWRPLQEALTGKKSTTKLDKVSEIDEVYEHLNRYTGEKFGIHVPFPSEENNGSITR